MYEQLRDNLRVENDTICTLWFFYISLFFMLPPVWIFHNRKHIKPLEKKRMRYSPQNWSHPTGQNLDVRFRGRLFPAPEKNEKKKKNLQRKRQLRYSY